MQRKSIISTWTIALLTLLALFNSFQYALAEDRKCDMVSQFCWSVLLPAANASSDQNYVQFKLEAPDTIGWVGLGIGDSMKGSYMIIAWPNSTNSITISQRSTNSYSEPRPSQQQSDLTLDPSSGVSNGSLTAIINRPLSVQGSTISTSSQSFIWAASNTRPSDNFDARLSIHNYKGGQTLDQAAMTGPTVNTTLDANDGSSMTKTQKLIYAHAAFMSLAWLFLSPCAIFLVRFGRKILPQWWFSLHWWLQVFGTTLFVSLGFLCIHIQDMEFESSSVHQAHSVFGNSIFFGTFIQVFIGYIHHKLFKPNRGYIPWWTKLHWWVGRLLQVLALVQIPIGFNLIGVDQDIYFAYMIYLAVVVILFVSLSIKLYVQKKNEEKRVYNKVES